MKHHSNGGDVAQLATTIRNRYDRWIDGKRSTQAVHSNRASALGHPCAYHGFLNRVAWHLAPPPDRGLQRIFERGNFLEPVMRRLLEDLGIRVVDEQRAMHLQHWNITGHFDGTVADTDRWGRVLMELKTTGNPMFAAVKTITQLRRKPLGERWYGQVQLYMRGAKFKHALLVILDVVTFQLTVLHIPYDAKTAQALLRKATAINKAVDVWKGARGRTPSAKRMATIQELCPQIARMDVCRTCPHYGGTCFPAADMAKGVRVVADDEIEEALRKRMKLEPKVQEFKQLDAAIKARVKFAGDRLICGDTLIINNTRTDGTITTSFAPLTAEGRRKK